MPPRRKHDQLTKQDVALLLANSKGEDHLFLMLLAKTGRRLMEILKLTPRDIDYENKCIWTLIEKRRAPHKRKMFVDSDTLTALAAHVQEHNIGHDDKIFTRCVRMYQYLPDMYMKKAGIKKYVTCHSFRHYFITCLIADGWSYDMIAKLTGHVNLDSIAAYDHATIESVEAKFRGVVW
jgi:integrase